MQSLSTNPFTQTLAYPADKSIDVPLKWVDSSEIRIEITTSNSQTQLPISQRPKPLAYSNSCRINPAKSPLALAPHNYFQLSFVITDLFQFAFQPMKTMQLEALLHL